MCVAAGLGMCPSCRSSGKRENVYKQVQGEVVDWFQTRVEKCQRCGVNSNGRGETKNGDRKDPKDIRNRWCPCAHCQLMRKTLIQREKKRRD